MLTQKQKNLLMFINERLQTNGVPPSFDEMKDALELKSKSGIHRLITALEERGFIRRLPHKARALEILKLPESETGNTGSGFQPRIIKGGLKDSQVEFIETAATPTTVPLLGKIAAGVPIEAINNHSGNIEVPAGMIAGGDHFALEVQGDSMIDAGIMDGDTVLIKRCNTAENGTIVVALVDQEEATLKRIYKKGNTVELEAANDAYETRVFGPDRVDIQGRLVSLIRKF